MTVDDEIHALLACASSSLWLRDALRSALDRDSVDAANDAEQLSELLSRRCDWLWRSTPVIEEDAINPAFEQALQARINAV